MSRLLQFLMISVCLLLLSGGLRAAEADEGYDLEIKGFVDGYVTARLTDRGVVGVTLAIVEDGKTVMARGYGFDDLEKRRPVDSSRSLFRPGSISKTFTWTALMQLHEQGKVKLDADISEYLPQIELPNRFNKPITILDLMAHRPGFEDSSLGHLIIDRADRVQTLIEYLQTHQPAQVYAPGSTPAYSNYGSGLAGLIVANVSGMPFEDYVEEHLFKPLGMINSTFREPWDAQRPGPIADELRNNVSVGYVRKGAGYESTAFEFIGHLGPAGALSTTADDMSLWMLAHLGKGAIGKQRILATETAELMHRQSATTHPDLPGMAHGFIETHLHGYPAYGHGGGTAHFLSDMVMVPELGLGIFISTNTSGVGGRLIQGFARDFVRRFYPPGPLFPDDLNATEPSRHDVAGPWVMSRRSFTGPERVATPALQVAFDASDRLILAGLPDPSFFRHTGNDHYRSVDDPDDQIIFERDETGKPLRMVTSIPIMTGTRPGFSDRLDINGSIFVFALLTFTGVLLCAWRRMGRGLAPLPGEKRAATVTTLAAAAWLIVFIFIGVGTVGLEDPRNALFHYPTPPFTGALWMTLIAVALTALATVLSIPALQTGTWTFGRRLRHGLTLIAALLVTMVFWHYNLIGFHHL